MSIGRDEVDRFFATAGKQLPGYPDWEESIRAGERRARLAITLGGVLSPLQVTMTALLNDPSYLVMQINAPPPVCRLCLTGGHLDRSSDIRITGGHFHPWHANRPKGQQLPSQLRVAELLPSVLSGRDAAFAWFLDRVGIDSPAWSVPLWPAEPRLI